MLPTRAQQSGVLLILLALATFVALSALLRHYLPRELAANVEAVVIVGVVGVAGVWGWVRRRD